ncbi:hypothetical protein C4B63_104g80 [Trypanosoma cruzi]|uniref:Uncharacterized protein n=1 Tax=Trypanosoma cruzi TaxID=5693 RepID=A0A2V2USJ3_TRYCR|nr:hypothetical protein C4B63_104g80 [Trypanosoma cruzi]
MVVLGVMVKRREVPFHVLYPYGRLDQQRFQQEQAKHHGSKMPEENVPLFEYYPLHDYAPATTVDPFSSLLPYLYCIAQYLCNEGGKNYIRRRGMNSTHVVGAHNNVVSCDPSFFPASPPSIWEDMEASDAILKFYALQVQFIEVRNLQPTLPNRFKCHGEAWVCGTDPMGKRPMTSYDTLPFCTPYLIHRDNTRWDERSPAASAVFFVRKCDRIRVVIYEYATFGAVEIDLMQFGELWRPDPLPAKNGFKGAFNCLERWFPLTGGTLTDGEVCLRLFRVPEKVALGVRAWVIAAAKKERRRLARQRTERREDATRKSYSAKCSIM